MYILKIVSISCLNCNIFWYNTRS